VKRVLLVGNPNTGKSTLLNALTGAGARVGNFAGTTVSSMRARWNLPNHGDVELVDVPGTYSLAAHSPEERVAIRAIRATGEDAGDVVVVLLDATRLVRSSYLLLQVAELGRPIVAAVNFLDEARAQGRPVDLEAYAAVVRVPVVGIVARQGEGLDALAAAVRQILDDPEAAAAATPGPLHPWPDALKPDLDAVAAVLPEGMQTPADSAWAILSLDDAEAQLGPDLPGAEVRDVLEAARAAGRDPLGDVVAARYAWLDARLPAAFGARAQEGQFSERLDAWLLHPVWGLLIFAVVMCTLFAGLFSWSDPAIGLVEAGFGALGTWVGAGFDVLVARGLPVGLLGDFVVDGLIGGVGSVLVFLPQILLLFLFIAVLEDSGYLARAAHLMDRILRAAGLPGQAFVPMLSGFACAVPAIMATRTLPRARDRLVTMLVLPLTTCSARLPVYTLLVAALFPASIEGFPLPVRPLAMAGIYAFATITAVLAAIVLGRFVAPAHDPEVVLELVPYRIPSVRVVLGHAWRSGMHFVREAGGVILVATIVLWGLLTFPRVDDPSTLLTPDVVVAAEADGRSLDAVAASLVLEQTYGGRMGKLIEPAIEPLGYDWRMGVGILGSFAAREVFVATMGLVYGIGDDADEESEPLRVALRQSVVLRDENPVAVGMSLMVFFALAMQCTSTLAVLVKETRSYRWPAFVLGYMTVLAWVASFLTFQGMRLILG